jgi:pimeloyl-ACP methyl ester carboxylesterase
VHLLGHSWGTILAPEYYRAHPDRVVSLVLGSPALGIPAWEKNAKRLLKTLSDSSQKAALAADQTGRYDTPANKAANDEFWAKYVMRSAPGHKLNSSFPVPCPASPVPR